MSGLLSTIRGIRKDWGPNLYHFTRAYKESVDILSEQPPSEVMSARDVLIKILKSSTLNGGFGCIKWNIQCVCFTEAPLEELKQLFPHLKGRYEPYGISVPKHWLFRLGGRPVIYQTSDEGGDPNFPARLRFRHVTYDPTVEDKDFTWEREWRWAGASLTLDAGVTDVIVPSKVEAESVRREVGGDWNFKILDEIGGGVR